MFGLLLAARATLMNLFRCPLNLLVVVILVQDLTPTVVFVICSVFLLLAAGLQSVLNMLTLDKSGPGAIAGGPVYERAPQDEASASVADKALVELGSSGEANSVNEQRNALERALGGRAEQRRTPSGTGIPVEQPN